MQYASCDARRTCQPHLSDAGRSGDRCCGCHAADCCRGSPRHPRPVRLREIDAAAHAWLRRDADVRHAAFRGNDVTKLSDRQRSLLRLRQIGFVFQRFFLLPMLTARRKHRAAAVRSQRAEGRTAAAHEGAARIRRARRARGSPAVGVVRRRDAAGCDCACAGEQTWPAAGRRADGRARSQQRVNKSRRCSTASMQTAPRSSSSRTIPALAERCTRVLTMRDGRIESESASA